MSFITTKDSVKLYTKDWGEGRPVVLIHGWPLSADTWDNTALTLTLAGYRVVFYDRRGFGRSEQPFAGYDYDTLADDLAAVIEAKSLRDVSLVGFSMGGGEVARYMSRHGGRNVVQAGLISSVVPYMAKTDDNPDGVPSEVFEKMAEGIKEDRAHFFKGFFQDFFGVTTLSRPTSNETLEWVRNVAMMASLKATLDCAEAFATTDFRPDLSAMNVPTFVMHGTADKTVPIEATARQVRRQLPRTVYHELEGAPHGLFATHKEVMNEQLLSFLRSY